MKNNSEFPLINPIHALPSHRFRYELVCELHHPEGRQKNQELTADKAGHYKTPGSTRGSFVSDTARSEVEQTIFAKKVADFLIGAQGKKQYTKLVLATNPHFYGVLKKHLTPALMSDIKQVVQKDYVPLVEKKANGSVAHIIEQLTQ
jgi:protein required for attachment to host cells